jgi:cullin-associated NEDD8-dissociated protein 1
MDLLLTAGRLDPLNQEIIENACSEIVASEENFGLVKAVAGAQQLFAATPEFQITNRLFSRNSSNLELEVRNVTEEVLDLTEPENVTDYKAIVYLYMGGAMDSYSLLVPHSNCTVAPELVHQYMNVRGDIAIDPSDLHPVNATDSDQPCDTFGIHPSMTILKELYDSRMASFVANMGPLVEPIANKEEFKSGLKELPQSLFAHNTQKQVTQTVYAQDVSTDGILGRIGDAVNMQAQTQAQEDVFDGYSIKDTPKVLEGKAGVSRVADVLDSKGVVGLSSPADNIQSLMKELNKHVATSIFGETFSDKIVSTFSRIDALGKVLGSSTLVNGDCASEYADTSIGHQLQQVARVISSRNALKAKRDVFYVEQGGYDTHSDNGPRLTSLLSDVNNALRCFVDELIAQEIWANVTIVQASEFARTLTSNGLGTDHAWGGNYFILGGSVAGGKIHGQYPSDLTEDGPLNVGRGRLIPTTPWEGLWKGVAEWFDVDQENMAKVLPNLENFDEVEHVIATHDLFVST